jgi:glycosyltransferase involved in cell wall biosynthesis
LLGTYGRLSKCVEPAYTEALTRILHAAPEAVLVLPGLPDPASEGELRAAFAAGGVLDRVRFPGFLKDEYFGLLKATDIYCDSFSWTGGQSVLDAMVAGVPIVANLPSVDPVLDPTGTSAITVGGTYLNPAVPVAPSLDVDAYVRIALAYARDPALRQRDAALNRETARGYTMENYMDALDDIVREAIARHYAPEPAVG